MAGASAIEWTGHTWNPLAGCSVLSPGCKKCYAMRLAKRLGAMGNPLYKGLTQDSSAGAVWTGEVRKAPHHTLIEPLRRKKPTTYFVNSMSDIFHEDVPDEWIDEIFAVMALTPQHTFQVLTKRAARMRQWFEGDRADRVGLAMLTIVDRIPHGHRRVPWPLHNVWLGVSTERQQEADERIPLLLQTPAAVRFISAEPLLGPIDMHLWMLTCPAIDWVICGGESGHGYRAMPDEWAWDMLKACSKAGVPFFMKQMAGKKPIPVELFVREIPESA